MINNHFWVKVAENWCKNDDGVAIPDDSDMEAKKAIQISAEDLGLVSDFNDNELNDILDDLGLVD